MRNEKGTGLVEFLVAFGILVFGLSLFLKTTVLTLRLHQRARHNTVAMFLAEERMEALVAHGWEHAVEDCSPSGSSRGPRRRFRKEKIHRGAVYSISLEREELAGQLTRYTVSCSLRGKSEPSRKKVHVVLTALRVSK